MAYISDAPPADPNSNTDHPLTLTHAHFLIMGGFTVRVNDDPEYQYVLTGDDLDKKLVDDSNNECALIRDLICLVKVAQLKDRSKGDVISKGLAALQAGWFILSCITRWASHLSLTELEISTLAFAIVSLALYILWWDKPQSVGIQMLIHPSLKLVDKMFGEKYQGGQISLLLLVAPLANFPRADWRTQSRVPSMWWTDLEADPSEWSWDARRVFIPSAIIGLFFGAVHCIAWNFYFPTIMERTLWHVCAVAVGIGPALVLILMSIILFLNGNDVENIAYSLLSSLLVALGLILPYLTFFIARIGLLVLSLMALRDIPSSAYQTVPWLSYIPHI